MFRHIPVKNSSQLILNTALSQELVVELNEHNEEFLSGGSIQSLQQESAPKLGVIRGTLILT